MRHNLLDHEKPTRDPQETRGLKTDIFVSIRQIALFLWVISRMQITLFTKTTLHSEMMWESLKTNLQCVICFSMIISIVQLYY